MNWIYDHTEMLTVVAIILMALGTVGACAILALSNAEEVSKLDEFGLHPHDEKPVGKVTGISMDQDGRFTAVVEMFGDRPPLPEGWKDQFDWRLATPNDDIETAILSTDEQGRIIIGEEK